MVMVRRRGADNGGSAERYGGVLVYDKYPTEPDGRGATSPAPPNSPQFAGPPKNDTAANIEYSASKRGG